MKRACVIILVLACVAYGTMEFRGPLMDIAGIWTTGRITYTTTTDD